MLMSCVASGCQNATGAAAEGRIEPAYDRDTGKLSTLAHDSNGDGTHDTWAFMDGARLTRLEADENQDGKIDRWEYYPAIASGSARQFPERIERATGLDGQVSRREFFEAGVMARVEEDTDGNGKIDKWETYTNGALAVLALDTNGSGKPDRRLVYAADGSLERIEADRTGSGRFEVVR